MRKRFEAQLQTGQRPIKQTPIPARNRDGLTHPVLALRTLHPDVPCRNKLLEAVLPKKGKSSIAEKQQEAEPAARKIKNRHSAVESNIHALETRGPDKCPGRGLAHFKRYIGLAVCAYNLCCIGRALMTSAREFPLGKAA